MHDEPLSDGLADLATCPTAVWAAPGQPRAMQRSSCSAASTSLASGLASFRGQPDPRSFSRKRSHRRSHRARQGVACQEALPLP